MTVYPPAALPWDLDEVTASALAVLRLDADDIDAQRVRDAAEAATVLLDQEVDMLNPWAGMSDIPIPVQYAATLLTVELYRRKDAPFGVLNAWSSDEIMIRVGPDVMRSVRSMVLPFKSRWGVA